LKDKVYSSVPQQRLEEDVPPPQGTYATIFKSDPATTEKENFLSFPLQDINHLENLRHISAMYPAFVLVPTLLPKPQMKRFSMLFSTIIQNITIPNKFLNKPLFCKYDLCSFPLGVGL